MANSLGPRCKNAIRACWMAAAVWEKRCNRRRSLEQGAPPQSYRESLHASTRISMTTLSRGCAEQLPPAGRAKTRRLEGHTMAWTPGTGSSLRCLSSRCKRCIFCFRSAGCILLAPLKPAAGYWAGRRSPFRENCRAGRLGPQGCAGKGEVDGGLAQGTGDLRGEIAAKWADQALAAARVHRSKRNAQLGSCCRRTGWRATPRQRRQAGQAWRQFTSVSLC